MNIKNFRKINPIDAFAVVIIILFAVLVCLSFTRVKAVQTRDVELTVYIRASDQSKIIAPKAKEQEEVYLNSVDKPVKTVKVEEKDGSLQITVVSKGEIDGDRYIFNGQRILIGQKAEIHGAYFAQGYVKDIKYAD